MAVQGVAFPRSYRPLAAGMGQSWPHRFRIQKGKMNQMATVFMEEMRPVAIIDPTCAEELRNIMDF